MPEYIIHRKKRKTHLNSRIAVIIGKRKLLRAKNGDVSRKKWSLRKKLLLIFAVMFLLGGGFYAASNLWIAAYSDSVYDEIPRLPETYTAVVLGCSPFIGSTGRQNVRCLVRRGGILEPKCHSLDLDHHSRKHLLGGIGISGLEGFHVLFGGKGEGFNGT